MKRGLFVVLFVLAIVLLPLAFVAAQAPGADRVGIDENDSAVQAVNRVNDLAQNVSSIDYLGEQWRQTLLKWPPIAKMDAFFTKIHWLFFFLFGRDYELSLALFFAIVLWVITFVVGKKYFIFFKAEWMRYAASFAATVIIAQIQIFNAVANLFMRVYFEKYDWWWKMLIFLVEVIVLILYLGFLRYFGKVLEAQKKKKDAQRLAVSEQKVNTVADELTQASK